MKHEIDIKHEVIAEIDGCQIIRSESRTFDPWTGALLDSFKTRRQAEKFLKYMLTNEM